MRRVVDYLVIAALLALLVTVASFFVEEWTVATIPGAGGSGGTATVSGFPLPYAAFFRCCSFGPGYSISANTYYYYLLNLDADFVIWLAISLAVVFTFAFRRIALAAVAGFGFTLLTLLLAPLSVVQPPQGLEMALKPMGFPYDYLTHVVTYFDGTHSSYEFGLAQALADYALWTGVAAAAIGIIVTRRQARRLMSANSELPLKP